MTDGHGKRDSPKRILEQLAQAESYNEACEYYENAKRNNRFYHGDQWGRHKVRKIKLMTENFLQRPVSYFVAQIVSDDIGFQVDPLIPGMVADETLDLLPDLVDRVLERNDFNNKNRDVIKQAAIECEGCVHWYFDMSMTSAQQAKGDIRCELLASQNVLFGNPHDSDVQNQPYILIRRRVPVQQLRERAKALGCKDWEKITPDSDNRPEAGNEHMPDSDRATEILKYWKETGKDGAVRVHFCRTAGEIQIQADTDTGTSLYPVARMIWNRVSGSYHGSCPITSLIPAQITVNQCLTLVCEFTKNHGLPKVFVNQNAFPNGITNDPTKVYRCKGEPSQAVLQIAAGAEVPAAIVNLMDKLVEMSRDFIGTSDAALGNIRPDNTSAIVAVQKATAAPLLLQTQNFYQYVRECIRIVIDMMGAYYGRRIVRYDDTDGQYAPVYVDFSALNVDEMDLKISVGASAYWSELTAIQTLDNLVDRGIIPLDDPEAIVMYLNSVPIGYIPNRDEIVKYYEDKVEQQRQMAEAEAAADHISAMQDMAAAENAQQEMPQEAPQTQAQADAAAFAAENQNPTQEE